MWPNTLLERVPEASKTLDDTVVVFVGIFEAPLEVLSFLIGAVFFEGEDVALVCVRRSNGILRSLDFDSFEIKFRGQPLTLDQFKRPFLKYCFLVDKPTEL